MNRNLILSGIFFIALFAGCSKEEKCGYDECSIKAPASEIAGVQSYLSSNGITATQHCSGMFYTITKAGSGKAANFCSTVAVNYEGRFTNGTVFDKTTVTPATFNLSGVVTGFRNGIPLIKTGGTITLYIPPTLGYGANPPSGSSIPANSILIFNVELVATQ